MNDLWLLIGGMTYGYMLNRLGWLFDALLDKHFPQERP